MTLGIDPNPHTATVAPHSISRTFDVFLTPPTRAGDAAGLGVSIRVVDDAQVLSPDVERDLSDKLEALEAATAGGARALRRSDVGEVRVGSSGGVAVLDAPSHTWLAYRVGVPLVREVVGGGR